jgi:hypothetical protein
VHARTLPAIGRVVAVDARALRNGTFAAQHVRGTRRGRHVRLHGTITFADRAHHRFAMSASGVSLLVRCRRNQVEAAGTTVDVSAVVPPSGTPIAQTVTPVGTDPTVTLEGTVLAVDATARTLTLSADDAEQSGGQLTVSVPAGIDLSAIAVGDEAELLVTLHSDGTYTLAGLAGDGGSRQADDQSEQQGQSPGSHDDGGEPGSGGDRHGAHDGQGGGQSGGQDGQDD